MPSTLTSKGQTTIPKSIRDRLKLKPGDRVDFVVEDDGKVTLVPITVPISSLYGALPRPAKPLTLEKMRSAVLEGARSRSLRKR